MQAHILEEWRIRDVEQKADRATQRLYEIDALRNTVDSLESSLREARADIAELRACVSTLQDYTTAQLREEIERLSQKTD
jgi:prefoldin subunit 5